MFTEEPIARLERKIDEIAERQIDYIERTARLEGIVTNGLASNVIAIKEKIESICTTYDERLKELESFKWFRSWMNDLRDHLFQNILKLIFGLAGFYVIVKFGEELIKKVLG